MCWGSPGSLLSFPSYPVSWLEIPSVCWWLPNVYPEPWLFPLNSRFQLPSWFKRLDIHRLSQASYVENRSVYSPSLSLNLFLHLPFSISVNGTAIHPMAQAKNLRVILIPIFSSCPTSNLSAGSINSTSKMYSGTVYLSLFPLLPP